MDISKVIGARRAAISSGVVVLVSPTLVFISNLTEALLNKFGCASQVSGQDGLPALLDLLVDARIVASAAGATHTIDARIGIYLRWQDGPASRLVFDGAGRCGTYDGAFSMCAGNEQFAPRLRAWAERKEKRLRDRSLSL